jgi:hypothetical protein
MPDVRAKFFNQVMLPLLSRVGGSYRVNQTTMTVTIQPWESHIYISGLDANENERKKWRGGKFQLVVLDEAQDWRTDIENTIEAVLSKTLIDYNGEMMVLGTAGHICEGYWHDVCSGARQGWSLHRWSAHDNPYIGPPEERPHGYARWIERELQRDPSQAMTAYWRREIGTSTHPYGEWVADEHERLYWAYRTPQNVYQSIPDWPGVWMRLLSCDFGWEHPTAVTDMLWHQEHRELFIDLSIRKSHWLPSSVAETLRELIARPGLPPHNVTLLADPSSAQIIADLEERLHLPFFSAEKSGKEGIVKLFNDDLNKGLVLLRSGPPPDLATLATWKDKPATATGQLVSEWAQLVDIKDDGNDCSDTALYGWRRATAHLFHEEKQPAPNTPDREAEKMEEWAQKQVRSPGSDPTMEW